MSLLKDDPTGRIPPGQRVTEKFPVMTAGTPTITPLSDWDLSLWIEAEDGKRREVGRWDHGTIRKLGLAEITCDIHCVTRWSKLDTRWGGVTVDRLLTNASIDPAAEAGDLPLRYLLAECDGDYSANLRLEDLHAENGFVALDYDGAPLPSDHGGPARLVAPGLYFWKSAKWLRRLVLSPYDRKGFWERLGYHNYGDPWKQQRYRGVSADDHRTTLDTDLSRQIRRERLGR